MNEEPNNSLEFNILEFKSLEKPETREETICTRRGIWETAMETQETLEKKKEKRAVSRFIF